MTRIHDLSDSDKAIVALYDGTAMPGEVRAAGERYGYLTMGMISEYEETCRRESAMLLEEMETIYQAGRF